ncbi:MAG: carbonic anhydrase [Magnetococcales bacterium]|nr:carbonic anhydrase [Magnetococcales bacterium]
MCNCLITRRGLLTGMAALSVATLLPRWSLASGDNPNKTTLDQAMRYLREGNKRFSKRSMERPNQTLNRQAEVFSEGQHPFATIISCSDSRVPVELLFDRGIGDLFVVRVAGNVVHTDEIATCEYGVGHLGTPLIVVLGHSKCGAVTAVVKKDHLGGKIPQLVDNIVPAVERSRAKKNLIGMDALVRDAIKENVRQSISDIFNGSEELTTLAHQGKMAAVGGVYDLESGEVEWL